MAADDGITLGEVSRTVGRLEQKVDNYHDAADSKYVRQDIHEREMATVLGQVSELRDRFDNQERINRENQIRNDDQKAKLRLTWLGLGVSPILGVILGQIAQGFLAGLGGG